MREWRKTMCGLCPTSCALEVLVEDNTITKVRGDEDSPVDQGYLCRKALAVGYQQHTARLTHPLKRVDGRFEQISWDQALDEIAGKLGALIQEHGPGVVACAGEPAAWGGLLMGALGSENCYSSLAQELTGAIYVATRMMNNPPLGLASSPDYAQTDMLLIIGWNPMMSNMMPQAPRYLRAFSKDPDKILVVVDPRRSETARLADIHLPLRPGTDALLLKAMIATILQEGWHDTDYLATHADGFESILPWFISFDAQAAVEVCGLDYGQVREVCRLFATRRSSSHAGLGIEMGRHSTATSYLEMILRVICGRMGVTGGNVVHGTLLHAGPPAPDPEAPVYRTPATGYSPIMGMLPPSILPEEILSDGADRLRALIVCAANPVRTWPDTRAFERSFARLDLLVTIEMTMTETAELSDYILPAKSRYESWGGILPTIDATFPEIHFQLCRPILEAPAEARDTVAILVELADRLHLIPPIPASLVEAARGDRVRFAGELLDFVDGDPALRAALPFILAKTLGAALGSIKLAEIWFDLFTAPGFAVDEMAAAGFTPGPSLADEVLQALIDHPEGLLVGRSDIDNNLFSVNTPGHRIRLLIPEMVDWIESITAESEAEALQERDDFPLVLTAGLHSDRVANSMLRDPAWRGTRRGSTLMMNPEEAEALGLVDGQMVRVTTVAGSVEIELEVDDHARVGHVIMWHGMGLEYGGQTHGVNVNLLTTSAHRDRIAGTPLHRYVPCRVDVVS
ncbi:MAG: molybdopterin-containing oxidoreductase family protein [Thermoleophilia bacterium]|jgi:anaerobic selenocysteine-containing dehydrogenase